MFKCRSCEAKDKHIVYLQGLIDRLMVQTWPKVDETAPDETVKAEDENVAERITFGEG